MELTLYNFKTLKENGRIDFYRNVKIKVNDYDEVVIVCCDINKTAEAMFADSGVEFYLTIDKENKNKLIAELDILDAENMNQNLLNKINSEFGGEDSCFENIKDYLQNKNIEYNYSRW
ncbi:hypothetical protein DFQ10_104239 [Winogradskyella eximia]|uniref:Uncharacterized protein n=1 Tax=Winogradskyella eximia TaxID=262006 RepID=A0A3D9H533_9FLAO|nr:hypothetical protein [Winogradskyella eximia]RED44046.1 hypothetical protein DFQ10_104239 [Winogradskyella eximia]